MFWVGATEGRKLRQLGEWRRSRTQGPAPRSTLPRDEGGALAALLEPHGKGRKAYAKTDRAKTQGACSKELLERVEPTRRCVLDWCLTRLNFYTRARLSMS